MIFVKSSSTGKPKVKRTQSIRMTECSTCPKLIQKNKHKTDYERPQPIKIAQLLGQSENLKSIQKDSVRKRIQPERLGTCSTKKNIKTNERQNGMRIQDQCINSLKCVRRNLNFNEISNNSSQKNENKNDEPICKKVSKSIRKRSLILPPNTIKDIHLQKCSKNKNTYPKVSGTSNEVILMNKKDTIQKKNKKMEAVDVLPLNNNISSGHEIDEFSNHLNSKCIDSNYVQSFKIPDITTKSLIHSQFITDEALTINNENESFIQNNPPQEGFTSNQTNFKDEISIKSKENDECIQNLCSNLQNTNLMVSENNINIKHASSETICVNKDKIIRLECDLKDLLCAQEKNVLKLKSMLTCITTLLSGNDEKVTLSDVNVQKNTELGKVNNAMVDKEVQVESCCNLIQHSEENLKTPVAHTPQITLTNIELLNINKSIQNDKNNKENQETMNIKRMYDIMDGSFLELENQLNIKYAKSTQDLAIRQKTPMVTKYKQKRSFREYMALKSSMSFLETPDGKKFRSLCQIDNVDKSELNVTYISNKLLTDLHNLYSESPEF